MFREIVLLYVILFTYRFIHNYFLLVDIPIDINMSRGCGSKCVYMDCGKSARNNADLKFHKFPVNDNVRKKWILNSGKNNYILL